MRLLSLKENDSHIQAYLDMYVDYLLEQEVETGKKQNREEIKAHCERMLKERLIDSSSYIFIFEKTKNGVVGFAEVTLQEECFPDEDMPESCMKIIAFYISPSYRKQKLGSHFFKLVREWGREQAASLVEIEVRSYPIVVNQFLVNQGLELVGTGVKNCYRSFI